MQELYGALSCACINLLRSHGRDNHSGDDNGWGTMFCIIVGSELTVWPESEQFHCARVCRRRPSAAPRCALTNAYTECLDIGFGSVSEVAIAIRSAILTSDVVSGDSLVLPVVIVRIHSCHTRTRH